MIKKKKILITGATGFIGSNLLRRCLVENAEVHILSEKTANRWRLEDVLGHVKEHCADLEDNTQLEKIVSSIKPEIIFHLAAYGILSWQKDIDRIMKINFLGTVNLLNTCKKTGFEIFVNTGSVFEYGGKNNPLKENDVLEPVSDYGVSKAASTLFCQAVGKRDNEPIVTLRLFTPYGYYEEPPRLIPSVILSCIKKENPKVSSPGSVRDFIFIEDVVGSYIKVVDNINNAKGEIINIGYGRQYTVGRVVNTIMQLTGNSVKPEWGSTTARYIESKMCKADISKARKLLNWEPEYSLEEGLRKTIGWFRENIRLYKNSYCCGERK